MRGAVPVYKKPMYRGTTRVSEKCIACYPRIEGKDPLTGGEPIYVRLAERVSWI